MDSSDRSRFDDPGLADLPERFAVRERIGQGGMATVYLADDGVARAQVALKVLHAHLRGDQLVVERFRREIAAARRIHHPHIVRIHDLVEAPRLVCLVLEYCPGSDLKRIIRRRGALAMDEALALAGQILEGLDVAHRAGVIHRDIKPHNILVDDEGEAKITDFGLARVDDLIGVTTHTMTLGTPEYMAPELLDSAIVDGRSDLYGVGIVLFEMLTGKLPFRASTPMALMHLHLHEEPPNVCTLDPTLPAWLGDAVARAMAKVPEDRFATAREMLEALSSRTALVVREPYPVVARECDHCEAPMLPGVGTCVECGNEPVVIEERQNGGCRVIVDDKFTLSEANRDYLTFADKTHVRDTLEAMGGTIRLGESRLDKRLRSPPMVLAQHLSEEDGANLVAELQAGGITRAKLVPDQALSSLRRWMQFGRLGSSLVAALLISAGPAIVLQPAMLTYVVLVLLGGVGITATRAAFRMRPLARFDQGRRYLRESDDPLIQRASRVFAAIRSQRLRAVTRRILARGIGLHTLMGDSERFSEDEVAKLEQVLENALGTAERIALLEAEVGATDVAELHDRMERLAEQSDEATDIHTLDEIASEQSRLREHLGELDDKQVEIVRLSGQLLDASARLAKMARDADRVDADAATSMSQILQDLQVEFEARIELDAELDGEPARARLGELSQPSGLS